MKQNKNCITINCGYCSREDCDSPLEREDEMLVGSKNTSIKNKTPGHYWDENEAGVVTAPGNTITTKSVIGNAAINEARKWVGRTPYVWGGNSLENGADCSGFIVQIYLRVGVDLSANRVNLQHTPLGYSVGTNLSNAEPGDIITWNYNSGAHVALYSGVVNGRHKMIHALNSKYNTIEIDATAIWVSGGAYISAITRIKDHSVPIVGISDGDYRIMHMSQKYIDVVNGSMEFGAIIHLWEYANVQNQIFHVENMGLNFIKIIPVHSSLPLEVRNSSLENGAEIAQWEYLPDYNCKFWYLIDMGGGYVSIINKNSGKAMDVCNGDISNGTKIYQWEINNSNAQKFRLIRI